MNEPILRRNSLTPHLTWTVFTALFSLLLGYMSRDIWFYGPFLLVALLLNLFMFPRMGGFVAHGDQGQGVIRACRRQVGEGVPQLFDPAAAGYGPDPQAVGMTSDEVEGLPTDAAGRAENRQRQRGRQRQQRSAAGIERRGPGAFLSRMGHRALLRGRGPRQTTKNRNQ